MSTDPVRLGVRLRELVRDPDAAREAGAAARRAALARYGLERFLADWDVVLEEVAGGRTPAAAATRGREGT